MKRSRFTDSQIAFALLQADMTSPPQIGRVKTEIFGQNDPLGEETFCHEENKIHR